ncbi:acyl-CoA synthetase [Herbaspirillum sp. LeCh32-8]|uniref:AMP-binding protein n=1 Tax=Herbaspirillum sp. LeCh32-8 TaxID=2821356 RepID=UPI001AE248C2|nr:AMP-binding protein [Herbaspirillum sp. LeCh32-8]MBP0597859.1 acyl-CoA synthetase [Herbaspirillum sp. LeCh32-8]
MREAGGATPLNLLQLPFQHFPAEHVIGWRDGASVSNAQFRREILGWRRLLESSAGRRFALFHTDSLHFAAALFGAWLAGKTVYLPSDALPDTCCALQGEVDGLVGDIDAAWQPLRLSESHLAPTAGDDAPWPVLPAGFPGLVVYTSGSTGQAQAIPKTLAQMANEVATLEALFGDRLDDAEIVATVSHQHIYGLLFKVLWPIPAARAVHAQSAFFPEDLKRMVPPRPWALLSSPAHLKRFPEQPTLPDAALLRAVFSSGGPLPAEAARQTWQLFDQRPLEIYGSSETGGIAWRQPHHDPALREERWQAMPGVDARVNAEGTLEVRSPHLPDDGWFAMADRAEMRDGANRGFTLHGRADRIVKLEEKRISLDQIERLLLASPLVAEARVLVHEGKRGRQFIAAFAVPTADGRQLLAQRGKPAMNAALRTALAGAIEGIALPRLWRYLDAMPVNQQGKITVAALTALLEPATSAPAASPRPTLPDITELQRDVDAVRLSLRIPPDLLYFEGHFPGSPILPGVVQTDWALLLGRRYFEMPPRFLGVAALKFQRVVVPGAVVTLELQYDAAKSALSFRLHSEGGQHASGRFMLGPQ